MFTHSRTITLLAICALAACLIAPAAATAQTAPGEEQYEFTQPSAGNGSEGAGGESTGEDKGSDTVAGAAADSADEGGLPILLIVLAGTALAGAAIAIMRRQKS